MPLRHSLNAPRCNVGPMGGSVGASHSVGSGDLRYQASYPNLVRFAEPYVDHAHGKSHPVSRGCCLLRVRSSTVRNQDVELAASGQGTISPTGTDELIQFFY